VPSCRLPNYSLPVSRRVVTVQSSDVRLAKAFYAQESCVAAIQNRLRELVAILYGIPILLKKFSLPTFKLNRNSLTLELIDLCVLQDHPLPCRRRRWRQHILETGCTAFQHWQILHKFQMQYEVWQWKPWRGWRSRGLTGVARQTNILSELAQGGACTVIASLAADLILSCIARYISFHGQ
jgi:hypothetical protein